MSIRKGSSSIALSRSETAAKGCLKTGAHGQKDAKSWTNVNHQLKNSLANLWKSMSSIERVGYIPSEAREVLAAAFQACMDRVVTPQQVTVLVTGMTT